MRNLCSTISASLPLLMDRSMYAAGPLSTELRDGEVTTLFGICFETARMAETPSSFPSGLADTLARLRR
jgi:hypothetical protein